MATNKRNDNKTRVLELINALINQNKFTKEDVKYLQKKKYCESFFNMKYPILLHSNNYDYDNVKIRQRYYTEPIEILNDNYYICNDWYDSNNSINRLRNWALGK